MRWLFKVLRGILLTVLILLCAALFYLLIIMGDTGEVEQAQAQAAWMAEGRAGVCREA